VLVGAGWCWLVLVGAGLDWTGLDWTGLDWTGLDWTGLEDFTKEPFSHQSPFDNSDGALHAAQSVRNSVFRPYNAAPISLSIIDEYGS
jgi:hypothetical protein